ncbi:hypothetical protein [Rhizobium grahamii]|nr:hypothetical protein [Rhizobium grahamii]
MRGFIFLIGLMAFLSTVDQVATGGRYGRVAWREAKEQAYYFKHQV